ncbi:hypothetical protein L7A47_33520, partial [Achromobacter xylosoxidans]|uniref:hypothetical protein n=1 Tax=Alcaligenes xylosoxydans xylosoxydans TaxID=85698 RepID=UPI001F10CC5D
GLLVPAASLPGYPNNVVLLKDVPDGLTNKNIGTFRQGIAPHLRCIRLSRQNRSDGLTDIYCHFVTISLRVRLGV